MEQENNAPMLHFTDTTEEALEDQQMIIWPRGRQIKKLLPKFGFNRMPSGLKKPAIAEWKQDDGNYQSE